MLRDESPRMKVIGASEMHRMDGDDNNGGGHSHKVDTVEVRVRAEAWTGVRKSTGGARKGAVTARPESATMAALPLAMAEVYDAYSHLITGDELRALQPIFKIYGRRQVFTGPIVTLKVFEDNVVVREFLEEKGQGRVLVVDSGGSLRCSILHGTKGGGARCCASHPEEWDVVAL
ncbi:Regulator of ribonuclease-like protein 2 [Hordeum vulgare]|nr:Regulator of ribonuclease-like protein 2 [Hordeum vulgare]